MSNIPTRLKGLRSRANPPISVRAIADALGMSHTAYHRYESENGFKQRYLPMKMARQIARVLEDRGVSRSEVMALAGLEEDEHLPLDLSPGQEEWLEVYDELEPGQRDLLMRMAREMLRRPQPVIHAPPSGYRAPERAERRD